MFEGLLLCTPLRETYVIEVIWQEINKASITTINCFSLGCPVSFKLGGFEALLYVMATTQAQQGSVAIQKVGPI